MQKDGEILKGIITVVVAMLTVIAMAFAVYVVVSPEPVQIVQKVYTQIDTTYYNVDENELNGEWPTIQEHSIDKNELNRYEDLKDYYKGRDNPFGGMEGYREQLVIQEVPTTPEEGENSEDGEEEIPNDEQEIE